jgi:hypothetical protein
MNKSKTTHRDLQINQTTQKHHPESPMNYFDSLHRWCIIRPMPNLQSPIVARFRRRSDAEAHLQVLRRLIPNVTYQIIFDVQLERTDLTPDC